MRQYTPISLTVPAGTTQAAPAAKAWSLYPAFVHSFRINIPAGHNGLTGVRIVYHGTPVIPFDLQQFLIGNAGAFEVPFGDEVDQSGVSLQGFNTDIWPHTFYCYADVDPYYRIIPGPAAGGPRPAWTPLNAGDAIAGLARITGG